MKEVLFGMNPLLATAVQPKQDLCMLTGKKNCSKLNSSNEKFTCVMISERGGWGCVPVNKSFDLFTGTTGTTGAMPSKFFQSDQ